MPQAPIYKTEGVSTVDLKPLRDAVAALRGNAPSDLLADLSWAVAELELAVKAVVPIARGGRQLGYGVDKAKKAIACDLVISIVREIKKVKGW